MLKVEEGQERGVSLDTESQADGTPGFGIYFPSSASWSPR